PRCRRRDLRAQHAGRDRRQGVRRPVVRVPRRALLGPGPARLPRPRAGRRPTRGPVTWNLFAPCPRGLEPALAAELTGLGATVVRPVAGGVAFGGDRRVA